CSPEGSGATVRRACPSQRRDHEGRSLTYRLLDPVARTSAFALRSPSRCCWGTAAPLRRAARSPALRAARSCPRHRADSSSPRCDPTTTPPSAVACSCAASLRAPELSSRARSSPSGLSPPPVSSLCSSCALQPPYSPSLRVPLSGSEEELSRSAAQPAKPGKPYVVARALVAVT